MKTEYISRTSFRKFCALIAALVVMPITAFTQPAREPISELDPFVASAEESLQGWGATQAVGGSRISTAIRDFPGGLSVLTRDFIDDVNPSDIRGALVYAPGISAGVSNRSTFLPEVNIRGIQSNQLDGIGLRDGIAGSGGRGILDPITIERVEVIRGPAAILYGPGSFGGIINQLTKSPQFKQGYSVQGSTGSWDSWRVSADATGPINEKIAYRVIAARSYDGSFSPFAFISRTTVAPSLTYAISEKTNLTIFADYVNTTGTAQFMGDVLEGQTTDTLFRFDTENFNPTFDGDRRELEQWGIRAFLRHNLTKNITIRQAFVYQDFDEPYQFFPTIGPAGNTPFGFARRLVEYRDTAGRNWNAETDILFDYTIAPGVESKTLVNFGFEHTRESRVFRRIGIDTFNYRDPHNQPDGFVTNPFIGRPRSTVPVRSSTLDDPDDVSWHISVQEFLALLDGRLNIMGGLRYDKFFAKNINQLTAVSNENSGNNTTPRVGASFRLTDAVTIYGLYTESFSPNTGQNPDGATFSPTVAESIEFGFKSDFLENRLNVEATYYDLEINGLLQINPNLPNHFIQSGLEKGDGVELAIMAIPHPQFQLIFNYRNGDRVASSNGLPVANAPKNTGNIFAKYTFDNKVLDGWSIGGGGFFNHGRVEGFYTDQTGTQQARFFPNYEVFEGFVSYERENFQLHLNVKNIFDKHYHNASSSVFWVLGDPRNFRLTATYSF